MSIFNEEVAAEIGMALLFIAGFVGALYIAYRLLVVAVFLMVGLL